MNIQNKILVICGPTATGKSALAVELAKIFNGEIISADSRQVYRGLDIGSAKITHDEMQGIPHHMIDIADPKDIFTVAEFKTLAQKKVAEIHTRGKLPILCGGTGMYISAVIDNVEFPEVAPDYKLRSELEQLTTTELFERLEKQDPVRSMSIDKDNPVRLIRALEIIETLGTVPSIVATKPAYDALFIGLRLPKDILDEKIAQRVINRTTALFNEIRSLLAKGVSFERLHKLGLEYRYGNDYVTGKILLPEFIELLTTKTIQFAKRQMTWFKRDERIHWCNPTLDQQKILKLVQDFLG